MRPGLASTLLLLGLAGGCRGAGPAPGAPAAPGPGAALIHAAGPRAGNGPTAEAPPRLLPVTLAGSRLASTRGTLAPRATATLTSTSAPTSEATATPAPSPTARREIRSDGAQRLTAPPAGASDQNPAFSPDGSRLVFTRFEEGYNDGPAALYVLDLTAGTTVRVTPREDQDNVNLPGSAWHPARDRIVFASDGAEAEDLWWVDPRGADLRRVTSHVGPPAFVEASWSGDGEWIVFEARRLGDGEGGAVGGAKGRIWKVRADGTSLTPLTAGDADDRQPNWSPVGDRIVFQRRRPAEGTFGLYTMNSSGGDVRPVTRDGTGPRGGTGNEARDDTDASWSPDGRFLVFSSATEARPRPGLFTVPALGGEAFRVTSAVAADSAPSWSPDGRWIAFESRPGEDDAASLWLIEAPDMNARLWPLWARAARLAGAAFEPDMTDEEIEAKVRAAADDGVTVLVVDGPTGWSYSAWVDDAEFRRALGLMRDRVIPRAHAHGLRVAWYLTGLELVCSQCAVTGRDPSAEHPDWLQVDRTGRPLQFTGLQDVFWLEPGDIDVWLAPESPYRDFYLRRVRELARAGADALWVDVAYYLNALGDRDDLWPSYDVFSREAFSTAYGHEEVPAKDWSSPAWRHFVRWRMESIGRFVADVAAAAREVDPKVLFFTENWGIDSNFVTQYAQDPLDFQGDPYVATAHELEPVDQDDAGMAAASLAQWQDYAAMVKFAVASNRRKAAWVLTYAGAVDDSLREAAIHLAQGASFYEAKGPEMLDDSTGSRRVVFSWLRDLAPLAADGRPVADVAVWFSPRTRDFIDGEEAGDDKFDYGTTTYIRAYRDASRGLLRAQIPFSVVAGDWPLADLAANRWLVLPRATCLSDGDVALLKGYVAGGGRLASATSPGLRDEWCQARGRGVLTGVTVHPLDAVDSQAVATTLRGEDKGKILVEARFGAAGGGRYLLIVLANLDARRVFRNIGVSVRLPAAFTPRSAIWSEPGGGGGGASLASRAGYVDVVVPRLEAGAAVVVRDWDPRPRAP